jgi:hypothetical protein
MLTRVEQFRSAMARSLGGQAKKVSGDSIVHVQG